MDNDISYPSVAKHTLATLLNHLLKLGPFISGSRFCFINPSPSFLHRMGVMVNGLYELTDKGMCLEVHKDVLPQGFFAIKNEITV